MFGRPTSQRIEFPIVNRSAAVIPYEIGGRSFTLPPQYARTHQQCRPAALRFRWPDGAQTPPKQESQAILPRMESGTRSCSRRLGRSAYSGN